jgi:hypothetical protein
LLPVAQEADRDANNVRRTKATCGHGDEGNGLAIP